MVSQERKTEVATVKRLRLFDWHYARHWKAV